MKLNRFDRVALAERYSNVADKDEIYRTLRTWGVKSPDDRHAIVRAIELAASRITNPPELPKPGDVILFNDRNKDPKLANRDIVEFMRLAWGKWMKARVLTRKFLREYDPAAERAVRYWIIVHGKLPEDIYVPTKQQMNDDLIAAGEAMRSPRVASVLSYRLHKGRQPAKGRVPTPA